MPRQLKYADRLGIPLVAILGPDEIQAGNLTLKHLPSGRQITCPREQASALLGKLLAGGTA
jgi:histidyl-tRNA synthetase